MGRYGCSSVSRWSGASLPGVSAGIPGGVPPLVVEASRPVATETPWRRATFRSARRAWMPLACQLSPMRNSGTS